MFRKLNRLRGTKSIWAKYTAIIMGLLFGFASWNPYIGLAVALGYLAGESMGWGEWIGGIIRADGREATRRDGGYNGIQWLATLFTKTDSLAYHILALAIRGFYWWTPTLVPLVFILPLSTVIMAVVFLSICFPLSLLMAKYLPLSTNEWKDGETYYGAAQDVVLGILWVSVLVNFL